MKIREILNKIQTELKAPKGQKNTFGNYRYRSCEDILEALKPHLKEHKCTLTIKDELIISNTVETEIVVVAKTPREVQTSRVYIKAIATITDEDGESISTSAFARESSLKTGMDSSQLTGATSSYARKYALNGLFCIDDTKDSDATNKHGKEEIKLIDKKELSSLTDGLLSIEADETKFCAFLKVDKLENLPKSQYQQACSAIEASKAKKEGK